MACYPTPHQQGGLLPYATPARWPVSLHHTSKVNVRHTSIVEAHDLDTSKVNVRHTSIVEARDLDVA